MTSVLVQTRARGIDHLHRRIMSSGLMAVH